MIHLKNNSEIEKLYRAGQVVKNTLFLIEESVKPGITTIDLDNIAEQYIKSEKCIPGFKGLYGYPSTLCISIDDEVVHGLPKNKALKKGQIVGIDVGAIFDGFSNLFVDRFSGLISELFCLHVARPFLASVRHHFGIFLGAFFHVIFMDLLIDFGLQQVAPGKAQTGLVGR